MLAEKQVEVMVSKLFRFTKTLERLMYEKIDGLSMEMYHTTDSLYEIPRDDYFKPCAPGDIWGGEKTYCWFKGNYTVPEAFDGQDLYIYPHIGGYEAMLWVDEKPKGIFATKITQNSHGNHYVNLLKKNAKKQSELKIALEYYAHHDFPGVRPLEVESQGNFEYEYQGVDICIKNQQISDFYFDLLTVLQLYRAQDERSFIKGAIANDLLEIHKLVFYDVENVSREAFDQGIAESALIVKGILARTNSVSAPQAGIIGHSHMDTAWLWHIGETIKKCARTYSNQLTLMEQYDEYLFLQSSTYHTELVRRHYPELFERIKEKVLEGRYEPNGGVWVESDCNIPTGEYLARQFLWGQRYTQEHFGYTSDTFWLPDTFGYSVSLPQIMSQSGISYFLTTKIGWNDTNKFPYDSFYWEGLDGSKILTHFNRTHIWPDVKDLDKGIFGIEEGIKERSVTNQRFMAYGFGDGGGGPQFEMVEMARRATDLEGVPKVKHQFVSDFMQELEQNIKNPSTYAGELYLELHRGTLTNQHTIKRNNRLSEMALHNLEYGTVHDAILKNKIASSQAIDPLTEILLVNQFHDILPGTSIQQVHEESIAETSALIETADTLMENLFSEEEQEDVRTIVNTLSHDREDIVYIPYKESNKVKGDYPQQLTRNIDDDLLIAIDDFAIPAFGSSKVFLEKGQIENENTAFVLDGTHLETPFYHVTFDERRYISSLIDKRTGRELKGEGHSLNTFLVAEDVPLSWDNWDVDADYELKFRDTAKLIKTELISSGAVEYRIRNTYQLTEKSTMEQDMIFYRTSPEITFESKMNWQDDHRFLKAAFDTTIRASRARQEVQFGYIERPTTRNDDFEKAKFEVVNHKYTNLSELNYGISILNDCKYGISVEGSSMNLSLHKGGTRPDPSGDKGIHKCSYAFLPHVGHFSAENVIQPSYEFNYDPIVYTKEFQLETLAKMTKENIIIETIKPLEDNQKGFIIRAYEAEGNYTNTELVLGLEPKEMHLVNLLEEELENSEVPEELIFNPFEIKTIKVLY